MYNLERLICYCYTKVASLIKLRGQRERERENNWKEDNGNGTLSMLVVENTVIAHGRSRQAEEGVRTC